MGSIQSKIQQSYRFVQKPCLKKKTQKSTFPSGEFYQRTRFHRKNTTIQNRSTNQLESSLHQNSFGQFQPKQCLEATSFESGQQDYFPASAIGLVQSTFDQQVHYGVGSLIGSNIVLTTASQLYSLKSNKEATQINFLLKNGSSQQQFEVEKSFVSQPYKYSNTYSQSVKEKILLEDYGVIVLKTHVDVAKYGLLGFDFSQLILDRTSQALLYGFNYRHNYLKVESIRLKAKLSQQNIKYNTPYNFTINGGPIISQQNGNYKIIGIQNQARHHHNQISNKYLRLSQRMFKAIGQTITNLQQEIDLRNKSLGKEGIKKLISLQKTSLSYINISRNNIGVNGLKYLTRCEWNHLHHLDIGGNEIKKQGVTHLIRIPMKNLLLLNAWGNQICSQGVMMMLEADWRHLRNINLYNNQICNEGIKNLIKAR